MPSIKQLEKAALEIRKDLLRLCSYQVIHIGGDLSCADVITALWQYKMRYNPKNPKEETRDRFILSKSHASAVTSFNQAAVGCFDKEDVFNEYASDGGRFSMHSCNLVNPFVEVSTGSLGHGFPIACGIAEGLRLKHNNTSRVYTVLGDGELAEGSIWEAAMNASHLKLGNIIAIVDHNGYGIDGKLSEMTGLDNIANKFSAFGWKVITINGNNMTEVVEALDSIPSPYSIQPTVIVCNTVKGCGVGFMENNPRWHAGKLTEKEYSDCVKALEEKYELKWAEKYERP